MTKPELLREIGIHLKKVVDLYNQIAKHPESFSPGEIDMMVNNAAKIIEFAAVLKYQPATIVSSDDQVKLRDLEDKLRVLNEQMKTKELEIERLKQTNKELESKVEEHKHLADTFSIQIPEVTDKIDTHSSIAKNDLLDSSLEKVIPTIEMKSEPVVIQPEVKPEEKPTEIPVATITPEPVKIVTEEKKTDPEVPKTLQSKFEDEIEAKNKKTVISTLNESVIDGSKENLADKMMNAKVTDLKKAIPLHEKFHYTNELFGRNNDHYTQFLDAMNTKQTWKEAEVLLAQAASMYNWDPENKTALQFIALIQRRFN